MTVVLATGVATLTAGPFVGDIAYRLLSCVPVGMGIAYAMGELAKIVSNRQMEKLRLYMPREVETIDPNDDEQVVSVTRGNGEHVIVTMPADYHPAQDGGLALFDKVCPDMPKKVRAAIKEAAFETGLQRMLREEERDA